MLVNTVTKLCCAEPLGTDPGFFGAREKVNIWVVVLLELVTKKELFILKDTCALGAGTRIRTLGKREGHVLPRVVFNSPQKAGMWNYFYF